MVEWVVYAYVGMPSRVQIERFLNALRIRSVSITHLGKSDPPRKFSGGIDEVVTKVFLGQDMTNYTFLRDATRRMDMDIQIRKDPRRSHSTISASCPDLAAVDSVYESVLESLDLYLCVRGRLGLGKDQPWEVLYASEDCPSNLRARFALT